jgi:hypothetical protein
MCSAGRPCRGEVERVCRNLFGPLLLSPASANFRSTGSPENDGYLALGGNFFSKCLMPPISRSVESDGGYTEHMYLFEIV